LLANLQKRGGVGVNPSREAEQQIEAGRPPVEQQIEAGDEVLETREEADLEPQPSPLPSVPEEEEGDGSSPLAVPGSTSAAPPEGHEEESVDDGLDARDDSGLISPHIATTEERINDLKSDDIVRESTTNSSVPEAACEMTSAETTEDPLEVTDMPPSVPVTSAETVEETTEVTRDVPSVSVASTETVEVRADPPLEAVSSKVETSPPVEKVERPKGGVAARWNAAVESSNSERRPSTASVDSLRPRPKATESARPPVATWCHVVETAPKAKPVRPVDADEAEAEAKPKPKPEKKFSDVHNFWKNHSVRFAGPAVGNKGISQVEAQAALQRLLSNSSAVDFNEVRRLRKLSEKNGI
jgi:hypothetical protein